MWCDKKWGIQEVLAMQKARTRTSVIGLEATRTPMSCVEDSEELLHREATKSFTLEFFLWWPDLSSLDLH
jgi:hypothetical protein